MTMRKDTREQLETLIDTEITGSEKTIATIESMLWVLYPDGIRPEEHGECWPCEPGTACAG